MASSGEGGQGESRVQAKIEGDIVCSFNHIMSETEADSYDFVDVAKESTMSDWRAHVQLAACGKLRAASTWTCQRHTAYLMLHLDPAWSCVTRFSIFCKAQLEPAFHIRSGMYRPNLAQRYVLTGHALEQVRYSTRNVVNKCHGTICL